MSGSGLFTHQSPNVPHLSNKELADLRADVAATFLPMAALTVQEFTNPGASTEVNLKAATAVTVAVQTILAAALLAPGLAILAAAPRNLLFATTGNTPADAPATVLVTGKGPLGEDQTETINVAQTVATATGVKLWSEITSVVYSAAQGTDASVSIGVGKAMYLTKAPKTRAGLAAIVREIAAGALVTTGVFDATNQSYTPSTAQDAANDYCVYYEYVPTT
jgi:hypothetical protein